MRREGDAGRIFQKLLDRHERSAGGRRIIERPVQAFDDSHDMRALIENLTEAARAGAIDLVWDRDAPHLIEQVILKDPARLYGFTGRLQPDDVLRTATTTIGDLDLRTEVALTLRSDLLDAWSRGARLATIGIADLNEARALIRATDAAFTDLGMDLPLRTRSARLLDDSKAIERALPSLLSYLRQTGAIDPDLTREEALEQLGLSKFLQPVLVAGPLTVGGADVGQWPYVGVPPELAGTVAVPSAVRTILTIENLESFNRHVRTRRLSDDVVVYIGGFPSGAVLRLLRRVSGEAGRPIHHWGDIDAGGVRIGRHIEAALELPVIPHLMDVALATRFGRKADALRILPNIPPASAFYELGRYLGTDDARWLEQEVIDPEEVPA